MHSDALEADNILSRLEAPMTDAVAASVLSWGFTDDAMKQMNDLASKAREGILTPKEKELASTFEHLNNLLGILKSRARQHKGAGTSSLTT